MSIVFRQIEWADHNTERSYPLTVDSSKVDRSGAFRIPDDLMVGMSIAVHAGLNIKPSKFYVKSIGSYPHGVTITIGYDDGDISETVATVSISQSTHQKYAWYQMQGGGAFSDAIGYIQIGKFDGLQDQPAGFFEFDPDAARLESDVIKPFVRGVSSIVVQNVDRVSQPIYGDVQIVAGSNCRIDSYTSGGVTVLTIHAIEGEGLNQKCQCEEEGPCIKTINYIKPSPNGNFTLSPGTCISLGQVQNGLEIRDDCSEPCCGCEELEIITQELQNLGDKLQTASTVVETLNQKINQLESLFLGSSFDKTCCDQ